jgi:hypothetical protein
MHRLMTARGPAGATSQKRGVVPAANLDFARRELLLEMALEAKILVSLDKQIVIHRAMRLVTGGAALAHRFVLENKWAALRDMTFRAGVHLAGEGEPATLDRVAFVRIVTIAAAHLSFDHGMMVRQLKASFHLQMTSKTNLGRLSRVDDHIAHATGFRMFAPRTMARFAADVLRIIPARDEARVRGRWEIFVDFRVAFRAVLRADKLRAWNLGRSHNRAGHGHARDQGTRGQQDQNDPSVHSTESSRGCGQCGNNLFHKNLSQVG